MPTLILALWAFMALYFMLAVFILYSGASEWHRALLAVCVFGVAEFILSLSDGVNSAQNRVVLFAEKCSDPAQAWFTLEWKRTRHGLKARLYGRVNGHRMSFYWAEVALDYVCNNSFQLSEAIKAYGYDPCEERLVGVVRVETLFVQRKLRQMAWAIKQVMPNAEVQIEHATVQTGRRVGS